MSHHSQSIDLKRLLHEARDQQNASLFDHLCSLLAHVDNNHADVALDDFENLSQFLTATKFAYTQYESADAVNHRKPQDPRGLKKHLAKVERLISEPHQSAEAWVQDFSETNCDWNVAGYGFGEEEARSIHLVLERLAAKNKADSVSFLGIVKGSHKDYFVAYGRLKAHVKDSLPESWEANGAGVNAVTFWVANESNRLLLVLSEWIELPAIGPDHVTVARFTKHALTGDLNAPVIVYPEFKGKEKHFLKAQLIRMLFNCEIVPTGMYRPKEDAKEDEKRKIL